MGSRMITGVLLAMVALTRGPVLAQPERAPETFTATANATTSSGAAASAPIRIAITRYTPEAERAAVEMALKTGGFAGFVGALRKAPVVGVVSAGERQWSIRWARQQTGPAGRTITLVTDQPIHFVGGGGTQDTKTRKGFDVALIQLKIDDAGRGDGTMAAAARVRPDGDGGVLVDDYAEKPITLTSVVRQ